MDFNGAGGCAAMFYYLSWTTMEVHSSVRVRGVCQTDDGDVSECFGMSAISKTHELCCVCSLRGPGQKHKTHTHTGHPHPPQTTLLLNLNVLDWLWIAGIFDITNCVWRGRITEFTVRLFCWTYTPLGGDKIKRVPSKPRRWWREVGIKAVETFPPALGLCLQADMKHCGAWLWPASSRDNDKGK